MQALDCCLLGQSHTVTNVLDTNTVFDIADMSLAFRVIIASIFIVTKLISRKT